MAIIRILPELVAAFGTIILATAAFRLSGSISSFFRAHAEAARYRAYAGTQEARPWLSVPVTVTMTPPPAVMQPAAGDLHQAPHTGQLPAPQNELPANYTILPPVVPHTMGSPAAPAVALHPLQIFSPLADHDFFLSHKLRGKK
jgi:hypothetical protein